VCVWVPIWLTVFLLRFVYTQCDLYLLCVVCKTTCVRCCSAFGALRWSGVGAGGFFFVHLYFCMFLLSVCGAVLPRF